MTTLDIVRQNQQTVQCVVLADRGQTVERSSVLSDTEPAGGTVCGTEGQWTDLGRQQSS